jgi:hypothetical protein
MSKAWLPVPLLRAKEPVASIKMDGRTTFFQLI